MPLATNNYNDEWLVLHVQFYELLKLAADALVGLMVALGSSF